MSEQLQHKLFHYHEQPPATTWDKINAALTENGDHLGSDKLIQYEEAPPPFIWDKISTALNENKAPGVLLKKPNVKTFRYSATAAAVIGVAVLISLVVSRKSVSEDVATSPVTKQNILSPVLPADTEKQTDTFIEINRGSKSHDMVYTGNKKVPLKRAMPLYAHSSVAPLTELTNHVVKHNYPIETSGSLNRYIIFSKSSGDAFRLSRKLYHLFKCSDTDENCKENIEAIQQRMADPALMASADFSGVLDLINNMNKN